MGWVENTFADELAYMEGIASLWHGMRDSVGAAVQEFNKHMATCGVTLSNKDCRANGQYCIRVDRIEKGQPPSSIEVYLNEEGKALRVSLSTEPEQATSVCGYKLMPDRSGLEYFEVVDGVHSQLSTEMACKKALHDFLFVPFPRTFTASEGKIVSR